MGDEVVLLPAAFSGDGPAWASDAEELDTAIFAGQLPEASEGYQPADLGEAEWAMRMLARLKARELEVRAQAEAWARPILEWEQGELARLAPGLDLFGKALEQFGIEERRRRPREATVRLPSGQIPTTMAKKPTIKVADEEAVIAWALENLSGEEFDRCIKTVQRPLELELRRILTTREVPGRFCVQCGELLIPAGETAESAPGPVGIDRLHHASEDTNYDEGTGVDHEPEPEIVFEVILDADHAVAAGFLDKPQPPIPGMVAELSPTTARPKPQL